jgi:hypothetical protein
MIKIEKGIPVPERSNIKYPWGRMEVGDSFFVKCEYSKIKHHSVNGSMYYWKKRNKKDDWKFTVRRVDGGIRAWRIK